MTGAELEVTGAVAGAVASGAVEVLYLRRPRRARHVPTFAEETERQRLERVRELFADDRIDLEQLEAATARVVAGLEPFPPVETARPRSVLEANGNAIGAMIRAASPAADEAARIRADRQARRDARERERWRH